MQTLFRGSPHTDIGQTSNLLITNVAESSNVQTLTTSTVHGLTGAGTLLVINGVNSTVDGTHLMTQRTIDPADDVSFGFTLEYSTASASGPGAQTPNALLRYNTTWAGGNVTNVCIRNYMATITTAVAHGLAVGDIVSVETKVSSTLGSRVLSVPTSTTFTYLSNTATVANGATTGAWGINAPAYTPLLNSAKKITNISITNRSPLTSSYSIFMGGVPYTENSSIAGGTAEVIDLGQIIENSEPLVLCASSPNLFFHVSAESL